MPAASKCGLPEERGKLTPQREDVRDQGFVVPFRPSTGPGHICAVIASGQCSTTTGEASQPSQRAQDCAARTDTQPRGAPGSGSAA